MGCCSAQQTSPYTGKKNHTRISFYFISFLHETDESSRTRLARGDGHYKAGRAIVSPPTIKRATINGSFSPTLIARFLASHYGNRVPAPPLPRPYVDPVPPPWPRCAACRSPSFSCLRFVDSYRRRVFFNYEKRIRTRSPPEKVTPPCVHAL